MDILVIQLMSLLVICIFAYLGPIKNLRRMTELNKELGGLREDLNILTHICQCNDNDIEVLRSFFESGGEGDGELLTLEEQLKKSGGGWA